MRMIYPNSGGYEQEPGRERASPFYREQERQTRQAYNRGNYDMYDEYNYSGRMERGRGNSMRGGYSSRMQSIGFDTSMHGDGESMGQYEKGRKPQSMEQGLTERDAEEWVQSMANADGSEGGKWEYEKVEHLLKERGIKCDPMEVWVGMNALYSDLCEVLRKYKISDKDVNFWIEAACAFWLCDEDAVEDKLSAYYNHVVK